MHTYVWCIYTLQVWVLLGLCSAFLSAHLIFTIHNKPMRYYYHYIIHEKYEALKSEVI